MDWVPSVSVLLAFSVAGMVLAFTPGPDMTLFLGRTFAEGRAAGVASLLGASSGLIVHTLLAVVGISAVLAASPTAFFVLKVAGALYLLWLAIQAIRFGSSFQMAKEQEKTGSLKRAFLSGMGVNIFNPKIVFFYVTFLPQFISASDPYAVHKLAFLGLFFVVISLPPMMVLIFMAHRVSDVLRRKPVISRTIDWIFASVFAAFAVRIILTEK